MAAPKIEPRTSTLVAKVDEAFTMQLAAFNSPTVWEAVHLPAGLSINSSTGLISGTPTTQGIYQVVARASNMDGADEVSLLIAVLGERIDPEAIGEWNDILVNFDLTTRRVTLHGMSAPEGDDALFNVVSGDAFNLFAGFYRNGVIQDVNSNGEDIRILYGIKELEPDPLITLDGGIPTKEQVGYATRYRIPCFIDPEKWAGVLSNYEDDFKTTHKAVSELELIVGKAMFQQTKSTSAFNLQGGMGGSYGQAPAAEKTITFNNLVSEDYNSYSLTVTLSVTGRPAQTISQTLTLDIEKSGGVWVVTNISPALPSDETGPVEGDQWVPTVSVVDISGDSSNIDVDIEVSTTPDGSNVYAWDINFASVLSSGSFLDEGELGFIGTPYLSLFDADGESIGSYDLTQIGPWPINTESFLTDSLPGSWASILSQSPPGEVRVNDMQILNATTIRLFVEGDTIVRGVAISAGSPSAGPGIQPSVTPAGVIASAILTGTLRQTTGEQPARFSWQFRTGVLRELIPNT